MSDKKFILVVDDDPDLVETVAMMLESKGCEVGMAYDGIEAEESIKERRPDLIILDIMMPRKDGYEVCQELRAHPDWKNIKIIMLTAKGRDVEREKGLALGADDYVIKPFATQELVNKVKTLLT